MKKLFLLTLLFSTLLPSSYLQATTEDPYLGDQYYLSQTHLPSAWSDFQQNYTPVVAIIDVGIDMSHPDLSGQFWINPGEIPGNQKDDDGNGFIDDINGYNFIFDTSDLYAFSDHATMVAGVIGAKWNREGIRGIVPKVKLMPLIACDGFNCSDEAIIKSIKYAADMGADVINVSLGGSGWNEFLNERYREIIDYAYNKNSILVFSAGNGFIFSGEGKNLNIFKNAPVCKSGTNKSIGVGSVDENNQKSIWSDYGNNCVNLMAPGENILSTSVPQYNPQGSYYSRADGTSFSAPIVSGIAALVKAMNPSLSNQEIINILFETADNLDIKNPDYKGHLGYGLVNASSAINRVSGSESPTNASQPIKYPVSRDPVLIKRTLGSILLQVEARGEAWYVNPNDSKRYYMKDGATAYQMMRSFGLGITDADLNKIPSINTTDEIKNASSICSSNSLANRLKGRILLQVQQHGEAYYIYPKNCRMIYMKDGNAAYQIMRYLGLGITNTDLDKIPQ